jgi:hypothetical protein
MDSGTITFNIDNTVPHFYWLVIRVGMRAVGYIAKNNNGKVDRFYMLCVFDSYGNPAHHSNHRTIEKAKERFFKLPLSVLPKA